MGTAEHVDNVVSGRMKLISIVLGHPHRSRRYPVRQKQWGKGEDE